ncbi:hypothetical protein C8R47DRAFT_1128473 [Mycena vitilis]|nr:hypothetical protein C8R47DRAFT_1128473 [Mycena vitilis]
MTSAATFCNVPLSTSFDSSLDASVLSLDWVLTSGVNASRSIASGILSLPCSDGPPCRMDVQLTITGSLPFDLVLGRDWISYCRKNCPEACVVLSSGTVVIRPQRTCSLLLAYLLFSAPLPASAPPAPDEAAMDVDSHGVFFSLRRPRPPSLICRCSYHLCLW